MGSDGYWRRQNEMEWKARSFDLMVPEIRRVLDAPGSNVWVKGQGGEVYLRKDDAIREILRKYGNIDRRSY